MNILLDSKKEQLLEKRSTVKAIMTLRKHLYANQEQSQEAVAQQQHFKKGQIDVLTHERCKDFSSIFTKQKRSQYSGYKQIYLNQSAVIKARQEQKPICRYQNSRKYEIKLKNIAKLRKRYSLQPIHIKQSNKDQQTINELQVKMNSYRQAKQAFVQTNRRMSSQKLILNTEPVEQLSPERVKLKKINRLMKINNQIMLPKLGQAQLLPLDIINIQKPNLTEIRSPKIKLQLAQKKKEITLQDELIEKSEQNSNELHGWSTQSFYPRKVFPFFNKLQN